MTNILDQTKSPSTEDNLELIKETLSHFVEKNIRPHVLEWDENQYFPAETLQKIGSLGVMGVLTPEEYGGAGLGYPEYVAIIQEIAKVCGAIGLSVAAHNSLCTGHILKFGSDKQKKRCLPLLASGQSIGAWALTEANTGSNALGMETTALPSEDGYGYILNGSKNWITHGKTGAIIVVMARTGKKDDPAGVTAFIVEKGTHGFHSGKKENKLGMRASETTELIFENCFIPKENILGAEGEGYHQAMKVLDGGRISIAALALGIAKGAFKAARDYSLQRYQFGKPIADFQAIAFKIADMATEIEAAEALLLQAAHLKNKGVNVRKESAMAKYYASEVAVKVATEAVQIFGGYGYSKDFPVEKFYRDAKLCTIGEGTSEIQKLIIAKEILKQH